jgi:hypothetical protein
MSFSKKLNEFFNNKGLTKKRDIAKAIETHEQVYGRWMKSDDISITFIERLTKNFPEIDLNYLLKNNNADENFNVLNEPSEIYLKSSEEDKLINEIEGKLNELKEILAQNRHKE